MPPGAFSCTSVRLIPKFVVPVFLRSHTTISHSPAATDLLLKSDHTNSLPGRSTRFTAMPQFLTLTKVFGV